MLSQSRTKEKDARRLGADHFFATSDPETFAALRDKFDLIINTVSAEIDVDQYLSLLGLAARWSWWGFCPNRLDTAHRP